MGAGPSLDGEVSEAKTIMADFLVKFAKNYSMLYAIGLAKESLKEQAKAAATPKWELLKAQKEVPPADRKSGHMLKRSKHLKKWNRRFFVVRGNWIVDFWEKEEDFTAGKKPRGTMNLSGMRIVRDPNDNALTKILDVAKKCGLDVDALPKPEKYPDFSLEVTHQTRDTFLLQCETAEDHKAWCDILDDCRWYSNSLNITDDKIHASIFRTAVWRTRWQCGIWGWWYSGGGEEQYITDCINDAIMDAVMPKVDAKLTMPWAVRSRIRTTFEKNVNTAVIAAVKPAWKAAFEGVVKVRPELKEKIGAAIAPVGEAQLSLQSKIMEKAEQPSKDALNDKVLPHLDPLLQKLVGPVNDAFRILLQAYDDALSRGKEHYKPREDRYYMVSHHSWNRLFWDADNKLWDLFDTLYDMRKLFDDVSPWGILGKARRRIRKHMQNALYTFETRLEEAGGAEHWDRIAAETREVLKRDCRKAIAQVVGKILYGVVENMWELVVIKPLRMVMAPLGEAIPDLVKQFVDPEDMLEKTLNNILLQTCIGAFEPYASRIEL